MIAIGVEMWPLLQIQTFLKIFQIENKAISKSGAV